MDLRAKALAGKLFFSYCAARATSIPATAQIGNIIYNPPGSGVNAIMLKYAVQVQVTSATALGLTFGISAQATTPTTVTAADASGCTFLLPAQSFSKGKVVGYAIATIITAPTPVALLMHNTAAINTVGVDAVKGDFDEIFIVPPGHVGAISSITAAVATAGMTSHLIWEEAKV